MMWPTMMCRMNAEPLDAFDRVRQMSESMTKVARDMQARLDRIMADVWRVTELLPDYDELSALEQRFMELMIQSDWPPPLEVSLADVVELMRRYELDPEGVRGEIDQWVMGFCSEDGLQQALESWRGCPLCRRRMGPLSSAVRAHLGGEYYCSVPVFLAQTEGLLCDLLGTNGAHHLTGKMRKKVRGSLETGVEGGIEERVGQALREYYLERVMGSVQPDSVPEEFLRRNLILHGADNTYGTEAMSWKAILLFDTIIESLSVAVIDGEPGLYHLPTCKVCQQAAPESVRYVHIVRPSGMNGRVPCPACGPPDVLVDQG